MISTVTTTTVTTITAISGALLGGLSFLTIVMLLGMLISKEVVSQSPRLQALNKALNVAIVPLLLAFLLIAAVRVLEVLH
jgi:hypothetical protein